MTSLRAKLIARLEEQKLILKDPKYTPTNRKWVKKDDCSFEAG